MKKKGFTLIELLGVIVLLTIITLITFLIIDKNLKDNKVKMLEKQIETIELAARNWCSEHMDTLPVLESTVSLLTLKIGGYVDVNISNPVTGKCFSNDNVIKIGKNSSGNYTYQLDRNNIKYGSCEINRYSGVEPTVSITGGGYIGSGQQLDLTITSNMPGLDKSYISLEGDSPVTSAEMSVGEEISVEEHYETIVTVTAGLRPEEFFVKVAEGAITTNDGLKSNEAISDNIIVDDGKPEITASKYTECEEDSYCHTFYNPNFFGGEYYEQEFCMDIGTDNPAEDRNLFFEEYSMLPYRANHVAKLQISESSGYYKYKVSQTSYEGTTSILEEKNYITDDTIYIYSKKNGYYEVEVCDYFGHCSTYEYTNLSNDCVAPKIIENKSSEVPLSEFFVDYDVYDEDCNSEECLPRHVKSDITFLGGVVSQNTPFLVDSMIGNMQGYNPDIFNSVTSIINNMFIFDGYDQDESGKKYSEYTYSELKNKATELAYTYGYCDQIYTLYLFAMDAAANISYYSEDIPTLLCEGGDHAPEIPEGDGINLTCGAGDPIQSIICDMKNNSLLFWTYEKEYPEGCKNADASTCYWVRKTLQDTAHSNNLLKCDEINNLGGSCEYSPSDGVYYDKNGNPLYTLDDTVTSSE